MVATHECPVLLEPYAETGDLQPRVLPVCGHSFSKSVSAVLVGALCKLWCFNLAPSILEPWDGCQLCLPVASCLENSLCLATLDDFEFSCAVQQLLVLGCKEYPHVPRLSCPICLQPQHGVCFALPILVAVYNGKTHVERLCDVNDCADQ